MEEYEECIRAFENGNKREAEQLLSRTRGTVVKTKFSGLRGIPVTVTLLHLAAYNGWVDIVADLITSFSYDAKWKDTEYGHTALYYAAYNGHLEVVKYLITEQHCLPMTRSSSGHTPLHIACSNGRLNIARYLISELKCDPSTETLDGWTPLHCACQNGHLNITQYLISEVQCDPSPVNSSGLTPLLLACSENHAHIVKYLLSTGKVNPTREWNIGDCVVACGSGDDLLKLFLPFEQSKKDFPVHTNTKLILTGSSCAGKSTIAQLVVLLARRTSNDIVTGCVTDVQCHTAGIVPIHIDNMVMCDFGGRPEYLSSHVAILKHIMQRSGATFLCMVDLSQSKEICESVQYWLSFIENTCSTAEGTSHVVIVGSHSDLVNSQELDEKSSLAQKIVKSRVKWLKYGGFVGMDCREADNLDAHRFVSLLSNSVQATDASQPSISSYCHRLYAFLRTKLKKTAYMLQELTSVLAAENDCSLPSDPAVLTKFLIALSDKAVILFIENKEHPQSSWVVVEKEFLLKEVNGTLFAPKHFKQHRPIASSTGIVSITSLQEVFPQHSSEMLVGLLQSLEFCQPVESTSLQDTNLKSNQATYSSTPTAKQQLLFFPGLVEEHRPDNLGPMKLGWCLGCRESYQFFSSRFLHVLLLRLAFTFPLASQNLPPSSSLDGLQQRCQVWRNGILWQDISGVSTVVEILDKNQWVIVLVSERSRRAAETCSKVIRMILNLHQELCKAVEVCECLISPSLLDRYPFTALPDTDLFDMRNVARSILLRHKFILDCKEGRECLPTEEAIPFEPYYLLSPFSVCQLFDSSMTEQPVPATLLREVRGHCHQPQLKPQNYKELRECVNGLSIFAGRNPLEVAELNEEDIISHTAPAPVSPSLAPTGDPSNTLTIPTSCVQLVADVAGQVASQTESKKKQQLLVELDTIRRMYQDKDQQILRLKEELQAKEKEITSLRDQLKQREEMQEQKAQTLDLATLTCFKYKDEQGVQQRIFIIDDMAPRWKEVGTILKFSEPDIENIDSTCHGDAVKCCRELLSKWVQSYNNSNDSRPKTWEILLEVIRDARLGELADKLETVI